MQWHSEGRHRSIANFLWRLVNEVPTVARDLLDVTFGDFGNWIADAKGESAGWRLGTCGCLVGSAALCAVRDTATRALVEASEPPNAKAVDILLIAWSIALGESVALYKRLDPWGNWVTELDLTDEQAVRQRWIEQVGMDVYMEATPFESGENYTQRYADRHAEMADYIHTTLRELLATRDTMATFCGSTQGTN